MNNFKFLINTSNLHTGGGVQVAVSLLDEMSRMDDLPVDLSVLVSDEVYANLKSMNSDCTRFSSCEVFNTYGLSTLWSELGRKVRGFDVVFTVFGPLYLRTVRQQVLSVLLSPGLFIRTMKYTVQCLFFRS